MGYLVYMAIPGGYTCTYSDSGRLFLGLETWTIPYLVNNAEGMILRQVSTDYSVLAERIIVIQYIDTMLLRTFTNN